MKILVIDNYDSFTFNVVQYLWSITGIKPDVVRNDAITLEEVNQWDVIILSPGPGLPSDAGIMPAVIKEYFDKKPILGICLGHQAIGHVFGGTVVRASELRHGKTSVITHDNSGVFTGLPSSFEVTRYHSLVVEPASLPTSLVVTATTDDGTIMGVRHRKYAVEGVQFHPESILTQHGHTMLRNFLVGAQVL